MKFKYILFLTIFLSYGLWISSNCTAIQPNRAINSSSALQQIIKGLRIQEATVQNMRVWVDTKYLQLNKDGKSFQNGGQTRLKAIYGKGGRFYMNIWGVDGGYNILIKLNSPYMVTSYLAAYNGRVGMTYNMKAGSLGRVIPQHTGTISGYAPRLGISEGRWTARSFSIWGLPQLLDWDAAHNSPVYQQMTLLEFLEHPPRNAKISAKFSRSPKGRRVAVLTIIWQAKDVIFLDPMRNFSVLQDHQYFVAGWPPLPPGPTHWQAKPGTTFTVAGFWQPAPGVYYPKCVTDEFFAFRIKKNHPVEKNIINVNRVFLNDPKVNANTFVVHFPAGTTVTDESTGQIIRVGGTVKQQMRAIEKAVAAARKEVATQPAQKGDKQ